MSTERKRTSSLRTRIVGSYLLIVVIFATLIAGSIIRMNKVNEKLHLLTDIYLPIMHHIQNLNNLYYLEEGFDVEKLITKRNEKMFRHNIIVFPRLVERQLSAAVSKAEKEIPLIRDKNETTELELVAGYIKALLKANNEYETTVKKILSFIDAEDFDRARMEEKRMLKQKRRIKEGIVSLVRRLDKKTRMDLKATNEDERRTVLWTSVFSIIALLLAVGYGMFAVFLLKPLSRLSEGARLIAEGDTSKRVDVERNDEIGELARDFNRMAEAVEAREKTLIDQKLKLEKAYADLTAANNLNEHILASIRSGLIVASVNGDIEASNKAAADIFHEKGDLNKKNIEDLPFTAGVELLKNKFRACLAEKSPMHCGPLRTKFGRLVHVQLIPLEADKILIVFEDITEETEANIKRIEAERLATIGQMAAQVTHEIRNPLNSLGLNLELLRDEIKKLPSSQNAAKILDTLEGEIERLRMITERYLEVGRNRMVKRKIDPVRVIRNLVDFMREELTSRKIAVEIKSSGVSMLTADVNQLRQVLMNLIKNAAEAIGENGKITIECSEDNGQVVISIKDTGTGIDPALIPLLFTPFTTTKEGGSGLGLAVCRRIVAAHGGSIEASNNQDKGCTFTLRFPLKRINQEKKIGELST